MAGEVDAEHPKAASVHASLAFTAGLWLAPCWAAAAPPRPAGTVDLGAALVDFARAAHIDLVLDDQIVRGLRVAPLTGVNAPAEGLAKLLAGTDLAVRRTPDGVYMIYARRQDAVAAPVTLPELVVVGRQTQNIDIRRTENDIQPYQVLGRATVETSQRGNVEDLLRARLPADTQARAPSQAVVGLVGSARSAIDLRGLGPGATLVLVDGRRLPGIPTLSPDNDQPDLNGIPLGAIERIEALGGAAGGVYGPSALGGVVNVVLKREYDGADLQATAGGSTRGDAGHVEVAGAIGFSPNQGRTQISVTLAAQTNEPLRAGDRDYQAAARALQFRNDPAGYLQLRIASDAVTVFGTGPTLTLKPQFGGAGLGAATTYLPVGFSGGLGDAAKILAMNAGRTPLALPDDFGGERGYLASTRRTRSAIVSIRHALFEDVETYLDALAYRTDGRFVSGQANLALALSQNAPTNPFAEPVFVTFPNPTAFADTRERAETVRVAAGAIVRLPRSWTLTGDAALGSATIVERQHGVSSNFFFAPAVFRGAPVGGFGAVSPFGTWQDVLAAEATGVAVADSRLRQVNHFRDLSLRLAGPLLALPGGRSTLTALVERRREAVPASSFRGLDGGQAFSIPEDGRSRVVQSAYLELRAPVGSPEAAFWRRDFELQLAARYDETHLKFNAAEGGVTPSLTRATRSALTYTAGAKLRPLPALMLRASVATGQLPPNFAQLTSQSILLTGAPFPTPLTPADPKRGGVPISAEGRVLDLFGGDPSASGQRAVTAAIGAVFNPTGERGPRISIDYVRTVRSHEIIAFPLDESGLLAAEALFPNRVARGPLTDADRSLGYTAGPVTQLDLRAAETGRTRADTVDVRLDWPVKLQGSELRVGGSVGWQVRFRRRSLPTEPWINYVGHTDGPAAWRATAGLDWTNGAFDAGLSVQFIGAYRVTAADPDLANSNATTVAFQGEKRLPAQLYADAYVRRRVRVAGAPAIDMILGVKNLLDHRPPIVAEPGAVPYSTYGDPRRRRVDLTLKASF